MNDSPSTVIQVPGLKLMHTPLLFSFRCPHCTFWFGIVIYLLFLPLGAIVHLFLRKKTMVWTREGIVKILRKRHQDISFFEIPIPIKVFLEDINKCKSTHDRLLDPKILISIIKNDLPHMLDVILYGRKTVSRNYYVVYMDF